MASSNSALVTGNNLLPPQVQLVDPKTGFLTGDGYNYFLGLINQLATAVPTASVSPALKATGVTQATALALTSQWNVVTVASAVANGVLLGSFNVGQSQVVFNVSGATIDVYPPPGFQIDALGANKPYALASPKMQIFNFESAASDQIYSTQLG